MCELVKFEELQGKIITEIEGMEKNSEVITFTCSDGSMYIMKHEQDCCESVWLEDVCGNPMDLISSEILMAEESSNSDDKPLREYEDSYTWTYYRLVTRMGTVDLRWYGCSNGYYSESVNLYRVKYPYIAGYYSETMKYKTQPTDINFNIADNVSTIRFIWKDQKIEFTPQELFEKLSKL